jgi:hypothetical protein
MRKRRTGDNPFPLAGRNEKILIMPSKHIFLSATILVASLSPFSLGQSDIQPKWTASTIAKVKPEMRREFEGYLKELMAAYKKAGAQWFRTFETFAGDTTEYTTIVPVMKFGDLDGPSVVEKVLGETRWKHLSAKIARCYSAQTRQYATPHTEIEINKTDAPAGLYWVETRTLLAPGKMSDYLIWLRNEYRPALQKAGVARFQVSQPVFGAVAGEIVTTRMLNNLAEIDLGPVWSKALNDEEARAIAAKSVALVSSSNTRILRLRNDLSYSVIP